MNIYIIMKWNDIRKHWERVTIRKEYDDMLKVYNHMKKRMEDEDDIWIEEYDLIENKGVRLNMKEE